MMNQKWCTNKEDTHNLWLWAWHTGEQILEQRVATVDHHCVAAVYCHSRLAHGNDHDFDFQDCNTSCDYATTSAT